MFDGNPQEQNYTPGSGAGYDQPQKYNYSEGMEGIKKFIPIIIVIIVLAIAAFIGLNYLASQQNVTITLNDSDGKLIEGKITLRDSSSNLVTIDPKGTSDTFSAKLFSGDYKLSATATGYKSITSKIMVIRL